jgi:hypothetical protein
MESMDPNDFLTRLIDRAWSRYRVRVTLSKLEDWIAEYLVPAASPGGASWSRDCVAYRRALEVCRIISRAPEGRRLLARELRIQQWLSGQQFQDIVIRDDICSEFTRSKRELLRSLRYWFPLSGPVKEAQLKTIAKQMGEASSKILPLGFQYKDSELVALLALLESGQSGKMQLGTTDLSPEQAVSQITERWGLAPFLNSYFPGFVKFVCTVFAEILAHPKEFAAPEESVLNGASPQQYDMAHDMLRAMPWVISNIPEIAAALSGQPSESTSALAAPCREIALAIQQQQWRFGVFAILLIAVTKSGKEFREIGYFARDILPSVRKLITKCRNDPPNAPSVNGCNPWNFVVLLCSKNRDLSPEISRARFRVARYLWNFGLSELRQKYREILTANKSKAGDAH